MTAEAAGASVRPWPDGRARWEAGWRAHAAQRIGASRRCVWFLSGDDTTIRRDAGQKRANVTRDCFTPCTCGGSCARRATRAHTGHCVRPSRGDCGGRRPGGETVQVALVSHVCAMPAVWRCAQHLLVIHGDGRRTSCARLTVLTAYGAYGGAGRAGRGTRSIEITATISTSTCDMCETVACVEYEPRHASSCRLASSLAWPAGLTGACRHRACGLWALACRRWLPSLRDARCFIIYATALKRPYPNKSLL